MSHEDFLLSLYCIVDQLMKDTRTAEGLRQRGPAPVLSDAEVITIVVAGEFFGLDADTAIFRYFRRYHAAAFPALKHLVRTTFVRQAANLGPVIQRLWQRLPGFFRLADPVTGDVLWLVDSFPLRVCRLRVASASAARRPTATTRRPAKMPSTAFGCTCVVRPRARRCRWPWPRATCRT